MQREWTVEEAWALAEDSRGELITETLEWRPRPDIARLRIALSAFFDDVCGHIAP